MTKNIVNSKLAELNVCKFETENTEMQKLFY